MPSPTGIVNSKPAYPHFFTPKVRPFTQTPKQSCFEEAIRASIVLVLTGIRIFREERMDSANAGVDFSGLILGFCSAALAYLGYGDEGLGKNLILARQNIDIIEMLQQKTQGNLTLEEKTLIDEVVFDLKAKFVEVAQSMKP